MSKRANIFEQGKPEMPYADREEGPVETPQRATAAQLAARKIKTMKGPRRAQSSQAVSAFSQSTPFGIPQQQQTSNFDFGATAPVGGAPTNTFNFPSQQSATPSGGVFGNSTSSFPPAQAPIPGNSFSTSSFPAFGGGDKANAGSTFNPQPPSASQFNFSVGGSAGGANPFASSAPAPTTNGTATGGFSSPMFSIPKTQDQPVSTPFTFGGASQNNSAVTTATSNSLFGATAGPQSTLFGSSAPSSNKTATAAPPINPFADIGTKSSAPAPAASTGFNFPTPTPASTQSSVFGSLNASTPAVSSAASSNPFASLGAPAQKTNSTPFWAPTSAASNAPTTAFDSTSFTAPIAPATGLFNFSSTASSTLKVPESQPSSGLFNFPQSKPKTDSESTAPPSNFFNGFSSASQKQTEPTNFFGQSQQASQTGSAAQSNTNTPVEYPSLTEKLEANKTPFSFTPMKPLGDSSVNPSATATATSLPPPKPNPFAGIAQSPSPTKEKQNPFATLARPAPPSAEKQNPFATLPRPTLTPAPAPAPAPASASIPSPVFAPAATLPVSATSTMPTLTGAAASPPEAAQVIEVPKIARAQVPTSWSKSPVGALANTANLDQFAQTIVELSGDLSTLNQKFREKLLNLSPLADWANLSAWHVKESTEITKKIIAAKKERAAAMGITGHESSLSTKRKVNEETAEEDAGTSTPTKKFRGNDAPSTPTPQQPPLFSTTPKANPPASQTSNLFGNIIKNTSASAPIAAASSSSSTSTVHEEKTANNNAASSSTGFKATPFSNSFAAPSSKNDAPSQSGFQLSKSVNSTSATPKNEAFKLPSVASSSSGTSDSGGAPKSGFQVPKFGASTGSTTSGFQVPTFSVPNGNTNFASQFAKKAKTGKELAAERKKKAFEADYDSDDETEEEWNARWDAAEAKRKVEEEEKLKAASTFKVSTSGTSAAKSPFAFSKSGSGTSTPGPIGSRVGSPAPLISGGQSIFDSPPPSHTPVSNIFGHLSSGPSSNNQDESSGDEDDEARAEVQSQANQPTTPARSSPPPRRRYGQLDSGSENDESSDETSLRKKQDTSVSKPSLLSRMSRVDDADKSAINLEDNKSDSKNGAFSFGQSNGVQTPPTKSFFDFSKAASQTAPPKDNTYKPNTPIKFGSASVSETNGVPKFNFHLATPTPATTSPADVSGTSTKPAPFAFLSAGNPQSGPSSISGLSSRAGTPSSEADTKDSAAEDDDDEERTKSGQHDLSDLTDTEREEYDILFHTEQAIAKRQVVKEGQKAWENFARGALWILKNKDSGKALVRMRIPSGATPVNYNLLPTIQAKVTGSSKKMVLASWTTPDGKLSHIFFAHKNEEIANAFATAYNDNLPT